MGSKFLVDHKGKHAITTQLNNLAPQERNENIFLYKDFYMNGASSFLS